MTHSYCDAQPYVYAVLVIALSCLFTCDVCSRNAPSLRSEEGTVLVCTDSAARGIDIPGVTHVVQADFAATAIDFLHRVRPCQRAYATPARAACDKHTCLWPCLSSRLHL